jgi:hypothetical protein
MIFNGLWTVYRIWIGLAFSGFGSRSLLIQRCKNYAALRHFFVQRAVLPDEGRFYPTNEKRGTKGALGGPLDGGKMGVKGGGGVRRRQSGGVMLQNVLPSGLKKFFLYFFIKR